MTPEELYRKEFGDADSVPKESVIRLLQHFASVLKIERQQVKNLNIPAVVNWVAVTDRLPEEKKFRMSADVLTIAGDKMSVKCYDYELMRWTGSPHITVKYWMPLPEPPCL